MSIYFSLSMNNSVFKMSNNAHHKFKESKVTSSHVLLKDATKPQDIQFTMTYTKKVANLISEVGADV